MVTRKRVRLVRLACSGLPLDESAYYGLGFVLRRSISVPGVTAASKLLFTNTYQKTLSSLLFNNVQLGSYQKIETEFHTTREDRGSELGRMQVRHQELFVSAVPWSRPRVVTSNRQTSIATYGKQG